MAAVGAVVLVSPATAMAVSAQASKPSGHGGGSTPTGYDISWPQCGGAYPTGQAFGIVGVNDGRADTYNPCFASEWNWAFYSSGLSSQPAAQVYLNTGDPGNSYNGQPIGDWPTTGTSTLYGTCTTESGTSLGANSPACAYQYGYNMAQADIQTVKNDGISISHPWWLDVETGNTWQSSTTTDGIAMNVADIQGMESALSSAGVSPAGIYSTSYQWGVITNGDTTDFAGVPDWIPGARSLRGAKSNCGLTAFTGASSKVTLTQWSGTYDSDYSCV